LDEGLKVNDYKYNRKTKLKDLNEEESQLKVKKNIFVELTYKFVEQNC